VVHVAADYRLWIPDPDAMYRANVDGTRELLRLAREAGVPRFVYTSSVATMHFRTDGLIVNEDTPVTLADMVGHYKRSKFLAEQEAIAAAGPASRSSFSIPPRPSDPNDAKPTPTGPHLCGFSQRQVSRLCGHRAQPGGCAEVARTHAAALETGSPGKRYILGGENLTLKQILDKMSAITGIPSPTVKIPFAVAATYAFFEEWITGRILGASRALRSKRSAWAARRCSPPAPARSRNWLPRRPCLPGHAGCHRVVSRPRLRAARQRWPRC
jgi:dihydroflavonol-4-reductase